MMADRGPCSLLLLFSISHAASLLVSSRIPGAVSHRPMAWIRDETAASSHALRMPKRRIPVLASLNPFNPPETSAGITTNGRAAGSVRGAKSFVGSDRQRKHPLVSLNLGDVFGGEVSDGFPRQPITTPPAEGEFEFWIRFFFHGGKLTRDGVVRRMLLREGEDTVVEGRAILELLDKEGVDRSFFTPHAFSPAESGWVELTESMTFDATGDAPKRVDIKIMPPPIAESQIKEQGDGFFLMGAMGLKTQPNLGTLWRSSYQLGAAGIFLIGSRFATSSTDVLDVHNKIPLVEYKDWNHFASTAPYSARKRAVYILGSEDNGLPSSVIRACHDHVALPSVRYASYNAAVAGSIVMYDRVAKLAQKAPHRKGARRASKSSAEQAKTDNDARAEASAGGSEGTEGQSPG